MLCSAGCHTTSLDLSMSCSDMAVQCLAEGLWGGLLNPPKEEIWLQEAMYWLLSNEISCDCLVTKILTRTPPL